MSEWTRELESSRYVGTYGTKCQRVIKLIKLNELIQLI